MNFSTQGRRKARAFVAGDYGGAPVDYLMAIAIVYTAMVVMTAHDLIRLFGQ